MIEESKNDSFAFSRLNAQVDILPIQADTPVEFPLGALCKALPRSIVRRSNDELVE